MGSNLRLELDHVHTGNEWLTDRMLHTAKVSHVWSSVPSAGWNHPECTGTFVFRPVIISCSRQKGMIHWLHDSLQECPVCGLGYLPWGKTHPNTLSIINPVVISCSRQKGMIHWLYDSVQECPVCVFRWGLWREHDLITGVAVSTLALR